jgi:hypothetical protein
MVEFLRTSLARAGAEELATPREIIRDYLNLLNILRENPSLSFEELMGSHAAQSAPSEEKQAPHITSYSESDTDKEPSTVKKTEKRIITLNDIDI